MKPLNTVYIVDDDMMCQYIAKTVVESVATTRDVRVFSNGLEAIDAIERNLESVEKLPDMILLDIMMPVLDGWGFLTSYALLKPRVGKEILIYIITTSNNPMDVERAKNFSDVSGYMVKPVTRQKFLELIEQSPWKN